MKKKYNKLISLFYWKVIIEIKSNNNCLTIYIFWKKVIINKVKIQYWRG